MSRPTTVEERKEKEFLQRFEAALANRMAHEFDTQRVSEGQLWHTHASGPELISALENTEDGYAILDGDRYQGVVLCFKRGTSCFRWQAVGGARLSKIGDGVFTLTRRNGDMLTVRVVESAGGIEVFRLLPNRSPGPPVLPRQEVRAKGVKLG